LQRIRQRSAQHAFLVCGEWNVTIAALLEAHDVGVAADAPVGRGYRAWSVVIGTGGADVGYDVALRRLALHAVVASVARAEL
jgi:hypothetical protein